MEVKPLRFECQEKLKKLTERYWEEAREGGKKIAWCSALVPAEILRAMDFFLIFAMNNSATCGTARVSLGLCERAEEEGFSQDLCSYARTDIGSALMGDETLSPLKPPKPDLIIVGNGQCHSISKWLESLAHIWNIPIILIDVPFFDERREEAERYI